MSLIPPDSAATFNKDTFEENPDEIKKTMDKMLVALLEEARKNEKLTQRLFAMTKEAEKMNIL